MTTPRKPLTGILPGGSGGNDDIFDRFDTTEAADDFGPIPKGVYVALAVCGKIDKARTGTDCYKVEFRVIEGGSTSAGASGGTSTSRRPRCRTPNATSPNSASTARRSSVGRSRRIRWCAN